MKQYHFFKLKKGSAELSLKQHFYYYHLIFVAHICQDFSYYQVVGGSLKLLDDLHLILQQAPNRYTSICFYQHLQFDTKTFIAI